MNAELAELLARLVRTRKAAALGTLRDGAPFVSMVPYALVADGFIVHVSQFAAHTRGMLADARVSLLVSEPEDGDKSPLALMRVSVQGLARRIPSRSRELPAMRAAYLARFPDAAQMFDFNDFSIFLIRPESARFVAGFGQAHSLTGDTLCGLLRQ
jgi:putative heme iron utilization protein